MYVLVEQSGDVTLHDIDNFKQFHIEGICEASLRESERFQELIEKRAEENRFWLRADAVLALNTHASEDWVQAFWQMLEKAERFGFADLEKRLIKAHCTYSEPG